MKRREFLLASGAFVACGSSKFVLGDEAGDGIDDVFDSVRQENEMPAMAGAVIQKGKTVYGAAGVRKLGDDTPVQRDDPFHLGSCTKSMTATLAGMLVEEGKLKWESTLAEMLPDFAERMHEDYRPVTLEQLLAHRAGFPTTGGREIGAGLKWVFTEEEPGETQREQRQKFVERIVKEKPANPPGTKFVYSNRSFIVAGAILERLADMQWEEMMRQRIFEPLGMSTAGFGPMGTPGKVDAPWQHRLVLGWRNPIEPGPLADNPPFLGPAGTVHCSAGDWAKYILEHLRGESGGSKLLKAETFKRLHTPSPGENYAGGWIVSEREWGGGKVIWHNGSNTMSFAVAWLAPLRDSAFLAMTNQGGENAALACDKAVSLLIRRFLPNK